MNFKAKILQESSLWALKSPRNIISIVENETGTKFLKEQVLKGGAEETVC